MALKRLSMSCSVNSRPTYTTLIFFGSLFCIRFSISYIIITSTEQTKTIDSVDYIVMLALDTMSNTTVISQIYRYVCNV